MKKIYAFIFFVCSISQSFCQEQKFEEKFQINVNCEVTDSGSAYYTDAKLTVKLLNDYSIEIIPILDCFNSFEATNLKESIVFKLDKKNVNVKNEDTVFIIKHLDIIAKCFKWRVIASSNGLVELSDWKMFNFVN